MHHWTWHSFSTKDTIAMVPRTILAKRRYQKNLLLINLNSLQSMQIDLLKELLPCIFSPRRFWRNWMISIIENSRKIIDTLRIRKIKRSFDERKVIILEFYNLATNNEIFFTQLYGPDLRSKTFLLIACSMSWF